MSEGTDNALLERFEQEIWSKVPHLEEGSETKVVNATPLVDMISRNVQKASSNWTLTTQT